MRVGVCHSCLAYIAVADHDHFESLSIGYTVSHLRHIFLYVRLSQSSCFDLCHDLINNIKDFIKEKSLVNDTKFTLLALGLEVFLWERHRGLIAREAAQRLSLCIARHYRRLGFPL